MPGFSVFSVRCHSRVVVVISLLSPVLPVLLPTLIHAYLNVYSLLGKTPSGYNRNDYDDYEEEYNLDNNYSEFRKRRRGPGKRSRTTDDYSEDWKNSDYYQYWDKQNRELDSATQNSMAGMVVGLADSVSNAVKLIN